MTLESNNSSAGAAAPNQTGPVGSGAHEVRDGECIHSIAEQTGHFWETIWNDGGNADIKSARKNPDVLLPGDKLVIPPLDETPESGATEQRHRFRRKGVPIQLIIRVLKQGADDRLHELDPEKNKPWEYDDAPKDQEAAPEDEPEANQRYKLEVEGTLYEGTTDGDGVLKHTIVASARSGRLTLRPGEVDERVIELELGHMDPVTEPIGAAKRLNNLGFYCALSEEMTEGIRAALQRFQAAHGIDPSGNLDGATQGALEDAFGS